MTGEPWSVEFQRQAEKDLDRLDPQIRERVLTAIEGLVADPRGAPLRRLTGRPELRLGVGDWRVIVELDLPARTVLIQRVLPRGRAYDR